MGLTTSLGVVVLTEALKVYLQISGVKTAVLDQGTSGPQWYLTK